MYITNNPAYSTRHLPQKQVNCTFKSNYTISFDQFTRSYQTKNATCFFRGDLDWKKFCNLIIKNFKKADKVNIISVPCSDGSEPVSLLLKLSEYRDCKRNPQKYFPIKAYDIDNEQLSIARSNKIPMIEEPLMDSCSLILNAWKTKGKLYDIKEGHLELKENERNKITYNQCDIYNVIKNLPKDTPVVLLARNIFPYLNDFNEFPCVLQALGELKKGTLLATGDFDKFVLKDVLKPIGYVKTKIENCYIKET